MKFTVWSDLHAEINEKSRKFQVVARGDVLILAGDIFAAVQLERNHWEKSSAELARDFISFVFPKFRHVVYVFGNHEFYGSIIIEAHEKVRAWFAWHGAKNLTILDNDWVDVGGTVIYGTTLWSNLSNGLERDMVERGLNDYRHIKLYDRVPDMPLEERVTHNLHGTITGAYTHRLHEEAVSKLEAFLEARKTMTAIRDKPLVVVTHHAPSRRSLNAKHSGNGMDAGFASDLDDFIRRNPDIKVWVHGHTHKNVDYQLGETRIFANQHGYYFEPSSAAFDINAGFETDES